MDHFVERCAKEYHFNLEENPISYLNDPESANDSSFWDWFHRIDIFGREMNFNVTKTRKTLTTVFGGVMTIAFVSVACFFIYHEGKGLLFEG